MKVKYEVEIDFHPGTAALRRTARVLSDLSDVYGVRSVTQRVVMPPVDLGDLDAALSEPTTRTTDPEESTR